LNFLIWNYTLYICIKKHP